MIPYRFIHGAVSEGAIDSPWGNEGRLNWTPKEDPAIEDKGDSQRGDSQQASCLGSLIVSMHLLIVALI